MSIRKTLLCCVIIFSLTPISMAQDVSVNADGHFHKEPEASFTGDEISRIGCDRCNRSFFGEVSCYPRSRFFATGESLFLKLDQGTRRAVPVVINQDTGETVLTTHDLEYNTVVGPRLALGYRLNTCQAIEISYFGLHHWHDSAEAFGDNNLRLPGDLPLATQDFFDADQMRLDYASELHNVEVNYSRRMGCENYSFLVGFRYLNLNETFNIHANDIDAGGSDYNIRSFNHIYGAQIGGRWRKEWKRFGLDFEGKAGIFGNDANQQSFVGDFDNSFVMRNTIAKGSRATFIGELGLYGTYRLTNVLYARAGYNLLWVEGLARAMDQLDFTDTLDSGTALVFDKGAFLHGANVGLVAQW